MTDKRLARLGTVCLLVAVAFAGGGCARGGAANARLTVSGSTTLLPIAEMAAELYQTQHPGSRVLVSGIGSSAGIESVAAGSSDIGTSSRELKDEETTLGLVDTKVAFDGIAVIVNPSNRVKSLTLQQVKDIFQGKITNWSAVGGPDLEIELVNRDEASGTREAFSKIVLNKERFDPRAAVLPGTGQVRSVVGNARGAVGYISVGFVDSSVRTVPIDGVAPTVATVRDGTYPVRRVLHLFTKGVPTGMSADFIKFVLSDRIQQTAVADAGFIPIEAGD